MAKGKEMAVFDYSGLTPAQTESIKYCENEIDGIFSLSQWKVGQILLQAKESLPHGSFSDWHNKKYGWSESTVRNFMNIAKAFKTAPDAILISRSAQNLLSAPSIPELAREMVQERVGKNIPTSKADAQEIIKLTKENQKLQTKLELMESAPPKVVERVVEKVVEVIPADLEQREKDIAIKDRQANKILKVFSKLEREKEDLSKRHINLHKENRTLEQRIKKLEAQEEVSSPATIDAANAKKLSRVRIELQDYTIPFLMQDVKRSGGGMHETRDIITDIINIWADALKELDGTNVINI